MPWSSRALTRCATLLKVCPMRTPRPLQPTLWRTCRSLANRTRLQIFERLLLQPGQTVSEVAMGLKPSRRAGMASSYLRTLEARSLLTVRRTGRRVTYRPNIASGSGPAGRLVAALGLAFKHEPQPIEHIFKLATAFTHPRRIAIFRALQNKPTTLAQAQIATGISSRALRRHLRKLETRGFVTRRLEIYAVAKRSDAFGKELARLAAE